MKKIAEEAGLKENGFRLVMNTGEKQDSLFSISTPTSSAAKKWAGRHSLKIMRN